MPIIYAGVCLRSLIYKCGVLNRQYIQNGTVQLALFMSVDLLDILRYILSFMSCHIVYRDRYHHIDRCPFHPHLSK